MVVKTRLKAGAADTNRNEAVLGGRSAGLGARHGAEGPPGGDHPQTRR
jgi:hypothetical protein